MSEHSKTSEGDSNVHVKGNNSRNYSILKTREYNFTKLFCKKKSMSEK